MLAWQEVRVHTEDHLAALGPTTHRLDPARRSPAAQVKTRPGVPQRVDPAVPADRPMDNRVPLPPAEVVDLQRRTARGREDEAVAEVRYTGLQKLHQARCELDYRPGLGLLATDVRCPSLQIKIAPAQRRSLGPLQPCYTAEGRLDTQQAVVGAEFRFPAGTPASLLPLARPLQQAPGPVAQDVPSQPLQL